MASRKVDSIPIENKLFYIHDNFQHTQTEQNDKSIMVELRVKTAAKYINWSPPGNMIIHLSYVYEKKEN